MVTFNDIKRNEEVKIYIKKADESLSALGYTEHNLAHVTKVATMAGDILAELGASPRDIELARIAGYMHDIGNLINRADHSQSGAVLAFRILSNMGMDPAEVATVICAIGNHDEGTGVPVDDISAALILADKSDVRRTRVRNIEPASFDIHDRVNYSVTLSRLIIDNECAEATLELEIDTKYSSVMDYFEIFLERMMLCKRAADKLGLRFRLVINGQSLI
ncbi:MAG: HD domain-containing protein [Clostridia bacterium]|nr:HD domain-containing protein [Clostridia bacterium]